MKEGKGLSKGEFDRRGKKSLKHWVGSEKKGGGKRLEWKGFTKESAIILNATQQQEPP